MIPVSPISASFTGRPDTNMNSTPADHMKPIIALVNTPDSNSFRHRSTYRTSPIHLCLERKKTRNAKTRATSR